MSTLTISRNTKVMENHVTHTVLVVEDELMVRMPIAEYLRDCGYTVVEAGDATDAISVVDAEGPVSLVFSDIRMPGKMDGVDLAARFRSHYPDVPVLLTSGYHGGRDFSTASITERSFIEKPYSQHQVALKIAALLDQ